MENALQKDNVGLAKHLVMTIALVVAAALTRRWPFGHLGTHLPYITFYPAVAFAALIGGRITGIFATLLSASYVYEWQSHLPQFSHLGGLEGTFLFLATCLMISEAGERIRARERSRIASAMEMANLHKIRAEEAESAHRQIAASEERFRLITENAADAILVVNPEGHFIYANDQAEKLLGYNKQELLGMGIPDLTPEEDMEQVIQLFGTVKREGRLLHAVKQKRRDGTIITTELNGILLPDGNYFGSFREITERKKYEDQLKLFRSLLDHSQDSIEIIEPGTMRFLDVNDGACRELRYSREELLSMHVHDIDPKLDQLHEQIAGMLQASNHARIETIHRRKDGSTLPVEVSIKRIEIDKPYILAITRDITERRKAADEIAEYVRQLETSMQGTLRAISNMVEQRDPYTAGHERRVGIIAADIARELGWAERKCLDLEMICLVHDIGKIGIPSEILSKPGRLTPIEYELVKSHVARGYEILKDVPFPLPIAQIIYQHHERMDGSGYPQGLLGEQILPEARVLAVADVVESMASHRPYRPALGMEYALNELMQNRAKLYDADVVDALLRLMNEKAYQIPV